jgi:Tfp pilus assembly protein PilF
MPDNRLEALERLVAQQPKDSFLRYGLAMEYRNTGDLARAAAEFRKLIDADPDYVPSYFHAGQTLERLGRAEEARECYRQGIESATRKGDRKTRDELQGALDMME